MKNRKNKSRMQIPQKKRRFDFAHRSCTYKETNHSGSLSAVFIGSLSVVEGAVIPIKSSKNCPAILVAKVMRLSASKMTIAFAKGPPSNKKTAECFDSAQQSCSSTSIKSSKNCPCNSCGESYKRSHLPIKQTLSPVISRSRATKQSICVFLSPQHLLSLS